MTYLPVAIDGSTDRGPCTAAEVELRVAVIVGLLLQGSRRSELLTHAANVWGVSVRQTDRYIAAAREQIREDWQLDRVDMLAHTLSSLAELQREARKAGQLSVALGCINSMARLVQLRL